MPKISLKPEFMNITLPAGETFVGGSQEWYHDAWHKKSGCGPIAAFNIAWYILQKNNIFENNETPDYQKLIDEMYSFITPGLSGVDNSTIFINGFMNFASERNMNLKPYILDIPKIKSNRPSDEKLKDFIITAMSVDTPVAFLNLSNGTITNLENWHWVTIIAFDTETMTVDIADYSEIITINILDWLKTSLLGGAFVFFDIPRNPLGLCD